MSMTLLDKGKQALEKVPEHHLPLIINWLENISDVDANSDLEPEDLWLLVTGELKKMNEEIKDAKEIDDWRKYICEQE